MKKQLFTTLLFCCGVFATGYGQTPCSFGTVSESLGIGENISTGGDLEYAGAADFDVPFGVNFTVNQVTFDAIKTADEILYVNLSFLTEIEGLPGASIQNFDNMVPTSQEFLYEAGDFDAYRVVLDLPTSITFEKGKYFISLAANPGTGPFVAWDIAGEFQTYGVFDYNKFEDEEWGGTGYYNKVFQVIGTCEDSGETPPNLGDACGQGNESNHYEGGTSFLAFQGAISIADDFVVPENTTFNITHFNLDALLLGGGFHNATIKIRTSENNAPGQVLYSFTNKGPLYEKFFGYFDVPGPFDHASVRVGFEFQEPIVLDGGTYFIEVIPTPYASESLTWELTSLPGIGSDAYRSFDGGDSWEAVSGFNQVFTIDGFCSESLGVENPHLTNVLEFYPNPVTNILNINSTLELTEIALYNLVGQQVANFTSDLRTVNMESLSGGVYLVKATFKTGQVENFKVIKQ